MLLIDCLFLLLPPLKTKLAGNVAAQPRKQQQQLYLKAKIMLIVCKNFFAVNIVV
jgi:hypothetical protein